MQFLSKIKKEPTSVLLHLQMPLLIVFGLYLLFSIQRDFSTDAVRYYHFYVEAFRTYVGALILSIMMILSANLFSKRQ